MLLSLAADSVADRRAQKQDPRRACAPTGVW